MTEAEWQTGGDLVAMLEHLQQRRYHVRKAGRRKLRLFACACARRVSRLFDERGRDWVDRAERLADGEATRPGDINLGGVVWRSPAEHARASAYFALASSDIRLCARAAAASARRVFEIEAWLRSEETAAAEDAEMREQCGLLREVFGNPFSEAKLSSGVLKANGSAVAGLAQEIYTERAFERLPILADALEDAGCTDERILAHCRESGATHVRGCWVVDLALGKA